MITYKNVYKYTGESIYWYSGRDQTVRYDLKPGNFLLDGDKRLQVKPDYRTGPEPFEIVAELPCIEIIQDLGELLEAAKALREFIKRGDYKLSCEIDKQIAIVRNIAYDHFDCTIDEMPEGKLKIWLNRFIEWAELKVEPSANAPADAPTPGTECPAEFRQDEDPRGEPLTPHYCNSHPELWNVGQSPWFTRNYGPGKKLTKRFPIGDSYAYSYAELRVVTGKNDRRASQKNE